MNSVKGTMQMTKLPLCHISSAREPKNLSKVKPPGFCSSENQHFLPSFRNGSAVLAKTFK